MLPPPTAPVDAPGLDDPGAAPRRLITGVTAGCAAILLVAAVAMAFGGVQWPVLPGFNWAYATVYLMAGLVTAVLLMETTPEAWSRPIAVLAAGYAFSAFMTVPFVLSFPGVFGPGPLVGGPQSAPWNYYLWRIGFLVFVLVSTVLFLIERRGGQRLRAPSPLTASASGAVAGFVVAVVVIIGEPVLPDLLIGYRQTIKSTALDVLSWAVVAFGLVVLALAVAAARSRAPLRIWLVPVVLLTVFEAVQLPASARYRVGWYAPRILGMIATTVLLVALLVQLWRQSRALAAAREHSWRLAQIVEQAPAGYALLDRRGTVVEVNQAACDITGYRREELVGAPGSAPFGSADDPSPDVAKLLVGPTRSLTLRRRLTRRDGSTVWVDLSAHRLTDAAGRTSGVATVVADASGDVAADLDPRAPVATAYVTADGVLTRMSQALCTLVGHGADVLAGRPFADLVVAEDRGRDAAAMDQLRDGRTEVSGDEVRLLSAAGRSTWVTVYRSALRDARGALVGAALQVVDIDDRKRAEDAARQAQRLLERRSTYDELTGLLNRPTFADRLQAALDAGSIMSVLIVTVDGFRRLGNAMTRREADLVINEVGSRLLSVVGDSGLLARVGGDEFAIAIPAPDTSMDAGLAFAGRVGAAVAARPVGPDGRQTHITCAVGVTVGERGESAEDLLQEADLANREAQESGRGRCSCFDRRLREEVVHRITLVERVRSGLAAAEFTSWYQPVVALPDGHLDGYEALSRWVPGEGAVITPNVYLPAAEDSGLIIDIGTRALEAATARLARLPEHITIAVNASPTELLDAGFIPRVEAALTRHGVCPGRLVIELTEQAIFDVGHEDDRGLGRLADLGVRLYVDDFGTGYSTLAQLRDLPIAGLKLDRSFTAGLDNSSSRVADIAATLADLAGRLGIDSVAEGVETPEQAEILAAMGWRHAQGYLYGRPAPEDPAAG